MLYRSSLLYVYATRGCVGFVYVCSLSGLCMLCMCLILLCFLERKSLEF